MNDDMQAHHYYFIILISQTKNKHKTLLGEMSFSTELAGNSVASYNFNTVWFCSTTRVFIRGYPFKLK